MKPHIQIRFEDPKLETWFLAQMRKAETIIAKALDKVETLGHFERQSIERVVYHAGVIDMELIQLMNKRYEDFTESDLT